MPCGYPELPVLGFLASWPQGLQLSLVISLYKPVVLKWRLFCTPHSFLAVGSAAGIWWVEVRNAAKNLQMHRTPPQERIIRAENISSAKVEKLC